MKRFLCGLIVLGLLWIASAGGAEHGAVNPPDCPEQRAACLLLQMVLQGSFDDFDPEDTLRVRVLSSVYARLCRIDEADIAHTALETGLEEGVVREAWYGALKNGLWAWLLCEHVPKGGLNAERRILLLFVDPSSQADAAYQIEKIREGMTPTAAEALATASGAPEGFIHWLIQGEGE